jgi:hypothetical protein
MIRPPRGSRALPMRVLSSRRCISARLAMGLWEAWPQLFGMLRSISRSTYSRCRFRRRLEIIGSRSVNLPSPLSSSDQTSASTC